VPTENRATAPTATSSGQIGLAPAGERRAQAHHQGLTRGPSRQARAETKADGAVACSDPFDGRTGRAASALHSKSARQAASQVVDSTRVLFGWHLLERTCLS
jgi:hypothetical protein